MRQGRAKINSTYRVSDICDLCQVIHGNITLLGDPPKKMIGGRGNSMQQYVAKRRSEWLVNKSTNNPEECTMSHECYYCEVGESNVGGTGKRGCARIWHGEKTIQSCVFGIKQRCYQVVRPLEVGKTGWWICWRNCGNEIMRTNQWIKQRSIITVC